MLNNFKQFVPSQVCLSCDGCCRFKENDSPWRPKITELDRKQGLAEKILKGNVEADGRLKTKCHESENLCNFFDPKDHTCGIYANRPFECRLYPFILHQRKGKTVLSVHLFCPHVEKNKSTPLYQEYVGYLREYFGQPSVRSMLRTNSVPMDDYSAYENELEDVFVIN